MGKALEKLDFCGSFETKPAEREEYDLRRLTAVLQTLCHEGLSDSQVAVNCGGRKEIKEIRHLKDGTIEIVAEGA